VDPVDTDRRAIIDAEHVRLLAIFHFVAAGLALMGVAFLAVYLVIFQAMFANPEMWAQAQQEAPPASMLAFFRWFLGLFVAWFLVGAVGNLLSGLFLLARRHRVFSMVVAAINCFHIPLGTVLGVFTFLVLGRESVRKLYETPRRAAT
jgi:hypothetical protein